MSECTFATGARDPWCAGCGHTLVIRALQEALARQFVPHDVILVTDIGCIGMADAQFACHTVHGLHGRAAALAGGIALSRKAEEAHRKVVCLMGDGGASIGLQHLMECARLNVDVTLVVCNNQNYGMTGGQHSAYTLPGVKTITTPDGSERPAFDVCALVAPMGVWRARVLATAAQELGAVLERCLAHRGFALVESLNYCPSYAGKTNPEKLSPKEMKAFFEASGQPLGEWPATTAVAPFRFAGTPRADVLQAVEARFPHRLERAIRLTVAGSAGEGVQNAAEVFARAAQLAGLSAAMQGEYPVTVGKGFSAAFLMLSPRPILSVAQEHSDLALVTSDDGAKWVRDRMDSVRTAIFDRSLTAPPAATQADFRGHGARQAAFAALRWALARHDYFPEAALRAAVATVSGEKARAAYYKVLEGATRVA